MITVLSGPHVHKKSREQYKIEQRRIISSQENLPQIPSESEIEDRSAAKLGIGFKHTFDADEPTYAYFKREQVCLLL